MNAPMLKPGYLDRLTRPGPRLPGLSSWLLHEVWSEAAFEAAGRSPRTYLLDGERWVNALETGAGLKLSTPSALGSVYAGAQHVVWLHVRPFGDTLLTKCHVDA